MISNPVTQLKINQSGQHKKIDQRLAQTQIDLIQKLQILRKKSLPVRKGRHNVRLLSEDRRRARKGKLKSLIQIPVQKGLSRANLFSLTRTKIK